jgi:hypothetical protein
MDAPIYRFDRYEPQKPQTRRRTGLALEITRGQARQRLRPVRERVFLIGTASDCDLVLGDLSFPEAYAYLFVAGERVTIRRLGSGPPLFVCGEEVETAELFRGDAVTFGPFELRLSDESVTSEADGAAHEERAGAVPKPHCAPSIRVFDPADSSCQT